MRGQQVGLTPQFSVLRLVLDSGERLPCLVDHETWLPARVATRWAMRYRRYHTQSSTLADNLRILGSLYTWARVSGGFDLDEYLTQGNILTPRQIEAFACTLRLPEALMDTNSKVLKQMQNTPKVFTPLIDAGTFDHNLSITEQFLTWALDHVNRGGVSRLTLEQLMAERAQLHSLFESLRIGARPSERLELSTPAYFCAEIILTPPCLHAFLSTIDNFSSSRLHQFHNLED